MNAITSTSMPLTQPSTASRERIEHAARELESQFALMMIKSMRAATPGDPMGGETAYRDLHDQQLAKEITKGEGLGLQSSIIRQLEATHRNSSIPSGPLPISPARPAHPLHAAAAALPLTAGVLSLSPSTRGTSLQGLPAPVARTHLPTPPSTAVRPALASPPCTGVDVDCSSQEAFITSIWPAARQTATELGVSPEALVAQAALETNWGRSMIGHASNQISNNLFGIKAGSRWSGEVVGAGTHEFRSGQFTSERADFRAYPSVSDSFRDYANLVRSERYDQALAEGADVAGYAHALQRAGYATDPAYADKITAIANSDTLKRVVAKLATNSQG